MITISRNGASLSFSLSGILPENYIFAVGPSAKKPPCLNGEVGPPTQKFDNQDDNDLDMAIHMRVELSIYLSRSVFFCFVLLGPSSKGINLDRRVTFRFFSVCFPETKVLNFAIGVSVRVVGNIKTDYELYSCGWNSSSIGNSVLKDLFWNIKYGVAGGKLRWRWWS